MKDTMDRREFLKTLSLGALGGGFFLHLLARDALAELPWEEREDSELLSPEGKFSLSPMYRIGHGIKNEYPRVAITPQGRIWVVYVSEKKSGEGIFLREFYTNGEFSEEIQVSKPLGFEFQPRMKVNGEKIYIVWTSRMYGKDRSEIFIRTFSNGSTGKEIRVSPAFWMNWKPCLTLDKNGAIWVAWEGKERDHFKIMARRITGHNLSDLIYVTKDDRDNCRPALCTAPDGTVWIAWDRYVAPGNYNVYLKPLSRSGKEIRISHHPASDLAPSIAADKEGYIWIAWHSNRKGTDGWDIPRWFQIRAYKDGEFYEPVSAPLDKNLEKDGTVQGFEFMQVVCADDGRIILTGRPSHNFCLQWYKDNGWSRLYRFPKDGWGGRGQYVKVAFDKKGDLWVARRELNMGVLQSVSGLKGEYVKPRLKRFHPPLEVPALVGIERKPKYPDWNGYKFFFGDIHAHTWISDGTGDLDEFYIQRRDLLKDDFAVLTDHDTFVGNGLLPSEWEQLKDIATHYNAPGRFITMYGQEWTTARWPKAFGHKNIYHIDPVMPLLDHTDEESNTTKKIFARAKKLGAICIPHHIGWTGVDWENHDPIVQPLVEIVSVHGAFEYMGNQPIYHRGGKQGCFVQDGLARGLKFGIVGGSDSHGLIWHHRVGWKRNCLRAGMTCILAKELTREALFDAMKNRRTYATSGVKIRIIFEVADAMMGQEISITAPPKIRVDVASPLDLKWIQIIRGQTLQAKGLSRQGLTPIYTYGGEGYRSRFTYVDEKIRPGTSYYYLRVITEDGNMAWSSPVWVNYQST